MTDDGRLETDALAMLGTLQSRRALSRDARDSSLRPDNWRLT